MLKHGRLLFLCCVVAVWIWTACAEVPEKTRKPNIIVIFTDDHGYADLSCQKVLDDVRTPHIDALAAQGVRMTSGYCTAPQCVPSRAGLLTGMYQNRFGVENNRSDLSGFDATLTVAQRLKQAGYATGMAGKWHLGNPRDIRLHGFDDVYCKPGAARGWTNYNLEGADVDPGSPASDLYHVEANTAAARAFIKRRHKQPFFFYLAYRAPHVPLDPTQTYLDRFPGEMPERRRRALAMLSAVDDGVGGVMEALREYGLEKDTLVFFISDNGAPLKIDKRDAPGIGPGWDGSLNDPLNGEKGTLIEGGTRVPFIVSWKSRIPGGQVYEQPVISLDVAATAVAVAGQGNVSDLDGINLAPFLTGEQTGAPHDLLFWRWSGQAAVREGKWKYLRGGSRRCLYDLAVDMEEKNNLIAEHPEVAERLDAKLRAWSEDLVPPGLDQPMDRGGEKFFEHYLEAGKAVRVEASVGARERQRNGRERQ